MATHDGIASRKQGPEIQFIKTTYELVEEIPGMTFYLNLCWFDLIPYHESSLSLPIQNSDPICSFFIVRK